MTDPDDRVFFLDRFVIAEGRLEEARRLIFERYVPLSTGHGLTLETVYLTPPVALKAGTNEVLVTMSATDPEHVWRTYAAAGMDDAAMATWWRDAAEVIVDRTRHVLTPWAAVG